MKPVNQALSMDSVVPVLPAAWRPLRTASLPVAFLSRTWVRVIAVLSAALESIAWVQLAEGTSSGLPSASSMASMAIGRQ